MPCMVSVNSKMSMFCGTCSLRRGVGYTMGLCILTNIYGPESLPPCRRALVKHILRGLTSKWLVGAAASVVDNARTY